MQECKGHETRECVVGEGMAWVSGCEFIKRRAANLGKSFSLHLGTVFSKLIYLSSGSGSALPLFVLNSTCYSLLLEAWYE